MTAVDMAPPFLPARNELTSFFWDGARQGRLLIQRCNDCGVLQHPPRVCCTSCRSFDLVPAEVSGRGTIYSYTVAVQAFHPWFEARLPYLLAVVELEEQRHLKLVTNIVECSEADVRIGMAVQVVFERLSDELTLPMFRPTEGGEG